MPRFRRNRRKTGIDKKQSKQIKKLIKIATPETKVLQYKVNATATAVTSVFMSPSVLTQGINYGERIGLEQTHKRFRSRMLISNSNAGASEAVRIMYFYYMDDALPTAAGAEGLLLLDEIGSIKNIGLPHKSSFKVIYDKTFMLGAADPDTTAFKYVDVDLKLHGKPQYSGVTNVVAASASKGHLWRCVISTSITVSLTEWSAYEYTDA